MGKTLHDTIGIAYQDVLECFQENPDADEMNDVNDDDQLVSLSVGAASMRVFLSLQGFLAKK